MKAVKTMLESQQQIQNMLNS